MISQFWNWFFQGANGSEPGYYLVLRVNTFVCILFAIALANLMDIDPFAFAGKALFPAASILVSMAVAWTNRGATVLNDKDFRQSVIRAENPIEQYVYGYQLSLLKIMITVCFVAIMAGGGFNVIVINREFSETASEVIMYFLLCWSFHACWEVINFSNLLALLHFQSSQR